MNIRIESQGFELRDLDDETARDQLVSALGRLCESILFVDVFMRDVNGPKGGVDKQVLVRVSLRGRGAVAVEARRADWQAALANCARRARRSVRRARKKSLRLEKRRLRELRYCQGVAADATSASA